ncbi:MAG TPA: ABC transporter substrate-binding protein [Methylomirabilota bacterium]
MDRRAFLGLAAASALAAPGIARGQPAGKVYRIGYLSLRSGTGDRDEALRQGLREVGYVEGRNLAIEYRWAAGKRERLTELATDLVRLKMDVIVAAGTLAAEAARRATTTMPIVFAGVGDPVGSGLVSSLAHPGGNITGVTLLSTELAGKRLQILRELLPRLTRVTLLAHRNVSTTPLLISEMRAAAAQLGIQLAVQEMNVAADLPDAFSAMQRERAQALVVQLNPVTAENTNRIVELAAQHRLPAMYYVREFVDPGGLVSYGPHLHENYRQAATLVDKILKGTRPSDLPIEQPTKFELVVNLKAAKALGLTVPQSLLQRADEVVQ